MSVVRYENYPKVLQALELISQGHTVTQACIKATVTLDAFEKAIDGDEQLKSLRAEAERRGHDSLADALINIDNHKIHGQSDPKMARVVSDNIKWFLEKKDPKRFGQKVEVNHNVTVDRAITNALNAARGRVAAIAKSPDVVDAEFVTIPSDEDIMRDILS